MKTLKKPSRLPGAYLILMTALMYLPILLVMIYSVNASKLSSVWGGFSWKWYRELFKDSVVGGALINSLILGTLASLAAAVIGTLGPSAPSAPAFSARGPWSIWPPSP